VLPLLESRLGGVILLSALLRPEYINGPPRQLEGFLRLSLVTCPVALYPATSDTEKVSFNQINRKTGHRIKYAKVDADTGEEVASDDIMKGYKVDTDTYIEVTEGGTRRPRPGFDPHHRDDEFVPAPTSTAAT